MNGVPVPSPSVPSNAILYPVAPAGRGSMLTSAEMSNPDVPSSSKIILNVDGGISGGVTSSYSPVPKLVIVNALLDSSTITVSPSVLPSPVISNSTSLKNGSLPSR